MPVRYEITPLGYRFLEDRLTSDEAVALARTQRVAAALRTQLVVELGKVSSVDTEAK
jgi:hypothetical protein